MKLTLPEDYIGVEGQQTIEAAKNGLVTPDSQGMQLTRAEEVQIYKDEGGGVMTGLERGLRRIKQGLAGAGAALGDAIAPNSPTGPVGQFLRDQTERDKAEVQMQEEAIQALPQRPAMHRVVEPVNEAEN
ncbi:MAG: hypothetical protein KZQ73_08170 [Candidatus Thiodiazotropha sp. (ex Semelilucina semeliformis)]|nr:hypothetical protein [Candidatus Thiodiazotropha sp. (ex Semelilucina semeliformis)]